MKEFILNYIEEILFFTALILFSVSAFLIGARYGLFCTGLVCIIAENKITKIKKALAERR